MNNYELSPFSDKNFSKKMRIPWLVIKESRKKFYSTSPGNVFEFDSKESREKFIKHFSDENGDKAIICKNIKSVREYFSSTGDADFYDMLGYAVRSN